MTDKVSEALQDELAVADDDAAAGYLSDKVFPYSVEEVRQELARVKRARRRNIALAAVGALVVLAALVVAIFVGTSGSFRTVSDGSMSPVLEQGQVVHVDRTYELQADEIAVYLDTTGVVRFGRVIALPGEWVNAMSDGTVVVSDSSLSEGEAPGAVAAGVTAVGSRQVPTGGYCVMGDADNAAERILSGTDSFIRAGQVIGRAEWIAWPIWNAGQVG